MAISGFDIIGKRNRATCYAETVEDKALDQIRRMLDYDVSDGSKIRIMPDVHAGAGCTIGTTMTVSDRVCPNIVGVDIGCGMYTVMMENDKVDFEKLDKAVHDIPSSIEVWDEPVEEFPDLKKLYCYEKLENVDRLERSLGTLGGGNHFIEVDRNSRGRFYFVVHSGSRNLGKQVAEYYQKLAVAEMSGELDFKVKKKALIEELKAEGRNGEIQQALKELDSERKEKEIPDDLCYLTGESLKAYLHDLDICQRFAVRNREIIAEKVMGACGLERRMGFHTIHNYIDMTDPSEMILRKGAVSARRRELLLIPINMRDGSILAYGLGNPDWNYSAPHGAGRVMGRNEARRKLSMEEYAEAMKEVYSTSVSPETIDEAPMAYKNLDEILRCVCGGCVEIVDILKPVYNFKAADSGGFNVVSEGNELADSGFVNEESGSVEIGVNVDIVEKGDSVKKNSRSKKSDR